MNNLRADNLDPAEPNIVTSGPDDKEAADSAHKILRDRGCALIRGHLAPAAIDVLLTAAQEIYGHRDRLAKAGRLAQNELIRHTEKGIVDLADIPGGPNGVMDTLAATLIWPVASRILGHAPQLSGQDFIRRVSPAPEAWRLPYHQDESVLNRPLVNVWIPLHDCDDRHARIEVVLSGSKSLVQPSPQKGSRFAAGRVELDPVKVKDARPDGTAWSPAFVRGDAMLFLGSTIHRTFIGRGASEPRYSIELRLV